VSDKLAEIIRRCACGVHLAVNEHRDYYETVHARLAMLEACTDGLDIEPNVRAKMCATDTMIDLQCYPLTPIGFRRVLHYELDAALDAMLAQLPPERSCGGLNDTPSTLT
jgi:hypothetical protein